MAVLGCIACGPDVLLAEGADAEVYIRAMCEDRLAKYEDCEPDPELFQPITLEACIEHLSDFDDPCFAEEYEFFRCRVERLSCDEYFVIDIDATPGSPCFDFLFIADECRVRHSGTGR